MDSDSKKLKVLGQFGIGCVQFRPKDLKKAFPSFDTYVEQLRRSLEQIAAIRDIKISAEDSFANFEDGLLTPFPLVKNAEYPLLAGGTGVRLELTLTLRIPERTQREILGSEATFSRRFLDEVTAYFSYQYSTPLMFVLLRAEDPDCPSPSTYIRVVREFLRLEMQNNATCEFTVDVLGPSPFHADFTLQGSGEVSNGIKWDRTPVRGYDSIFVTVPESIESAEEIILHLEEHFFGDFDVYYELILQQSKVTDAWRACLDEVTTLKERLQKASLFSRATRAFTFHNSTYNLISEIADFRLTDMTAAGLIHERITGDAFIQDSAIWRDIHKEKETFPKYDIDSLGKLVDFVDRKQVHRQSALTTFFAAITGAITGALVASLLHWYEPSFSSKKAPTTSPPIEQDRNFPKPIKPSAAQPHKNQ